MTDAPLVTLSRTQTPIVATPSTDPLVQSSVAYVGRLRAEATRLRELAEKYDELATNSEPVPVVVPHA